MKPAGRLGITFGWQAKGACKAPEGVAFDAIAREVSGKQQGNPWWEVVVANRPQPNFFVHGAPIPTQSRITGSRSNSMKFSGGSAGFKP